MRVFGALVSKVTAPTDHPVGWIDPHEENVPSRLNLCLQLHSKSDLGLS